MLPICHSAPLPAASDYVLSVSVQLDPGFCTPGIQRLQESHMEMGTRGSIAQNVTVSIHPIACPHRVCQGQAHQYMGELRDN